MGPAHARCGPPRSLARPVTSPRVARLPGVVGWMARQRQDDCYLSVVSGIGRRREVIRPLLRSWLPLAMTSALRFIQLQSEGRCKGNHRP